MTIHFTQLLCIIGFWTICLSAMKPIGNTTALTKELNHEFDVLAQKIIQQNEAIRNKLRICNEQLDRVLDDIQTINAAHTLGYLCASTNKTLTRQ